MRRMTLPLFTAALLGAACLLPARAQADESDAITPTPKAVDLALCLDTSGSMSGLINAAREKLWKVVEELASLKPMPTLRVSLLTFGSPGNEASGHVVVQAPLTEDLDLISEKLFALGTRGGTEYVGRVMKVALDHLRWTREPGLKLLFVAGNESADQDRIAKFDVQAAIAKERGIVVNAIYCGGADDADAGSWRTLASLAGGRFANIDHNNGTVRVATPFDAKLTELSTKLNGTYLFYGSERKEARARQSRQDSNAESAAPGAAADRATAKASGMYRLSADLVDAVGKKGLDIAKVAEADLPEGMRSMTLEQRTAHIATLAKKRESLAKEIQALGTQRKAFIETEMKRQRLDDTQSLDRALRDMIREQAARQGFTVPAR